MVDCGISLKGAKAMAKSQKKSNREVRKPKATTPKPATGLAKAENPVNALMNKPKAKT